MADEIYINKFILATAIDYGIAKADGNLTILLRNFLSPTKMIRMR